MGFGFVLGPNSSISASVSVVYRAFSDFEKVAGGAPAPGPLSEGNYMGDSIFKEQVQAGRGRGRDGNLRRFGVRVDHTLGCQGFVEAGLGVSLI